MNVGSRRSAWTPLSSLSTNCCLTPNFVMPSAPSTAIFRSSLTSSQLCVDSFRVSTVCPTFEGLQARAATPSAPLCASHASEDRPSRSNLYGCGQPVFDLCVTDCEYHVSSLAFTLRPRTPTHMPIHSKAHRAPLSDCRVQPYIPLSLRNVNDLFASNMFCTVAVATATCEVATVAAACAIHCAAGHFIDTTARSL